MWAKKLVNTFRNKKKTIILAVLFLSLIIAFLIAFMLNSKTINEQEVKTPIPPAVSSDGPGGDVGKFDDLYNKAVKASKDGDKESAKNYANEALEENKKLKSSERVEIKDQSSKITNLQLLSRGIN